MTEEPNIFLKPMINLGDEQTKIDRLDHIFLNAKAVHFYLTRTLTKSLAILTPAFQEQISFKQISFDRFRNGLADQKAEQIACLRKVQALMALRKYRQEKVQKKLKQHGVQQKMNDWKEKAIFAEWKALAAIGKHSDVLVRSRRGEAGRDLLELLGELKKRRMFRNLEMASEMGSSHQFYQKVLFSKGFQSLSLNRSSCMVGRMLKRAALPELIRHMRSAKAAEDRMVSIFRNRLLLRQCFCTWKCVYQTSLALAFERNALLSRFFHFWRANLDVMVSEREIEENNDCIAAIFSERLNNKQMKYVFLGWLKWTQQTQQNRQRNQLLNTFAEKKRKHALLSRYFNMLKQHCINNKVRVRHYESRLKRKAFDGYKMFFRESVDREEVLLEYMEHREVKKCFKRIVQFNEDEQQKVYKFRLAKAFGCFTSAIISDYCISHDLAEQYHRNTLLFKTLFGLKREKTLRRQENYLIGLVNVVLPLRRWVKRHRVRNYLGEKEWFRKKAIFLEWKLMVIRKGSAAKAVRQFRETSPKKSVSESKMEEFEFENILQTIAKIRNNLAVEKQETANQKGQRIRSLGSEGLVAETPSRSIEFEYSTDNL